MIDSKLKCMDRSIIGDIMGWVDRIATPDERIGGFAVCPFARAAQAGVGIYAVGSLTDIADVGTDFEVIILVLPDDMTVSDLEQFCEQANTTHPALIFLPDHKDRNTFIGAAQTNNGQHNLVLCQPREKLKAARKKLYKTDYYKYWDRAYLEEILGEDIVNLD